MKNGSAARRPVSLRKRLSSWGLVVVLPALLAACAGDFQGEGQGTGRSSSATSLSRAGSGSYLAWREAQRHFDAAAAAPYLLKTLKADPENIDLLQLSVLTLASEGRLDDAAILSRRLLTFDREAGLASLLLAEREAHDGHWAAAEDAVAKLPRRGLNTVTGALVTAWTRAGQGHTDDALEALKPLAEVKGFDPVRFFHAALINDLAGRSKAAEENYRAVLAASGTPSLRTLEAAVSFYRRANQPDKAKELVDKLRQTRPDSAAALDATPPVLLIDNAAAGLAEVYFSALVTLTQSKEPDLLLSLAFGRMALDLRPDLPGCKVLIAEILQSMGRLADADSFYAAIDPSSEVYWATQQRLAVNMDSLGDQDGAVAVLEALATRYPDRADAMIVLGDLYRGHQRWAEAASAYGRAITVLDGQGKPDWTLYYSRGITYERGGQWPLSEADFLKALELKPNEPHVLNYLGYSWVDKGMNIERAQKMIEKAVEQLPTDGDIIDSQGWAFFRTGNYHLAVQALLRAIELHPEEATINDHLGDALWMVGRKEEARYQWKRALGFNPEPDQKTELEKKLKSGLKAPNPVK